VEKGFTAPSSSVAKGKKNSRGETPITSRNRTEKGKNKGADLDITGEEAMNNVIEEEVRS